MSPKKAGKKTAKKAAKKAADHGPEKRKGDARRCYEHFGRVAALLPLLEENVSSPRELVAWAQELLREGNAKDAADLLRAAEHLCFGTLAAAAAIDRSLAPVLLEAIEEQYDHLLERGEHHAASGDLSKPATRLFKSMRKQAKGAWKDKQYRAALEFARSAEAIAHVKAELAGKLSAGSNTQLEIA